jgi:hypothetical protein
VATPKQIRRRGRWSLFLGVVLAALTLGAVYAYADTINVDGDYLANPTVINIGGTGNRPCSDLGKSIAGQMSIKYNGSSHFTAGETVDAIVTPQADATAAGITATGGTAQVPDPWNSTTPDFSIDFSTSIPAAVADGTYHVEVGAKGRSSAYDPNGRPQFVVNIACASAPPPANTAPSVAFDSGTPASANEGDTKTFTFTITDPDANTWSFASGYPKCDALGSLVAGSDSITGKSGTFQCSFPDGYTGASATVAVKVSDSTALSNEATQAVSIANLNPVVAAPSWQSSSVNCRTSATLTGISFSDAGVIDYPWAVNINWGGTESPDSYNTNTQGAQSNQSHTYNTPGSYNATVGVTDKDAGSGSNTTSASLTVNQTYTVGFMQPIDTSSPTGLVGNTFKSGRIVPVKATIYDDCTQSYVTDPTKTVTIVLRDNGTGNLSANDAVEAFADAGASNSNTLQFRWTSDSSVPGGGFWIYNLDSRTALNGSAMVIGHNYRLDIFVGSVRATATQYAVLKPTK